MRQLRNQKGFTVVEVVIVIVVIAILVAGGWWVYNRNKNDYKSKTTSTTSTKVLTDKEVSDEVPAPKNASDLKKLDTQLNDASLGDTNVSNLNSQLDF